MKNLIEYWHRDTVQTQSATKSDDRPAMMPMFFRNTPKTATAIKTPKRILWQQGEFNIRQAEEQTQTIRSPECDLVIRDVVWKMAEVPFGAAAVTSIAMGFLLHLRPSAVVTQPRDRGEIEDTSGEVIKTIFVASREDFSNDVAFHISESKVPAGVAVGQLLVIQPERMQQSRVEVVNVDLVFRGVVTVVIG